MQLSDFLTYVRRDFKRTDKDTEITQAYNDMVMWVALQMPHGNYKFQSWVNTVAGQEDTPLPSNIIHIIHPIRLLIGSASSDSGYSLDRLTKAEYDIRQPNPNRTNPSTSRPSAYTIYSRSILLDPIPDLSTYIIEINWSKRPTAQSADSDTTSLGTEWDEILKLGTLERLYAGMSMYQDAQYYAGLYRDAEGNSVGMCRKLLEAERSIEGSHIGRVRANAL